MSASLISERAGLVPLALGPGDYEEATSGTSYVPNSSERTRNGDGNIRRKDGTQVSITARTVQEFAGTMAVVFFATMISVNYAHSSIVLSNSAASVVGAYTMTDTGLITLNRTAFFELLPSNSSFLHQSNNGVLTISQNVSVIENPLAGVISALAWSIAMFLAWRVFPGCWFNPWITMNHFFFQWKQDGTPLSLDHWSHTMGETISSVIAQFSGAISGIIFVYFMQSSDASMLGDTLPSAKLGSEAEVIAYEAIASFLLMSLINVYSRPRRDVSSTEQARFIAMILFVITLTFHELTGASMNFARTFAAALIHSLFSSTAMPVSVVYYLCGQAIGFSAAGLLAWSISKEWGDRFKSINKMPRD
jgi:glycerol uptake facilitator-like aquaporin